MGSCETRGEGRRIRSGGLFHDLLEALVGGGHVVLGG